MTDATPLDLAHAQMMADPDDDALRLKFYERVADAELTLLLKSEAGAEFIEPEVIELDEGAFVLAFDTEERLAQFVGREAQTANVSGRVLAQMTSSENVGLALNVEVAPSAMLLPSDIMTWLAETVAHVPDQTSAKPVAFYPPAGVPKSLMESLATKLTSAAGLAEAAYLVGVQYDNDHRGLLLGIVDANPEAQDAIAKAMSEALTFSGLDAAQVDVAFFAASEYAAAKMELCGLKFNVHGLPGPGPRLPPGSDPAAPPRLK